MTKEKKGFTCGFVYACAQLSRLGNDTWAEMLWNESGLTKSDLNVCDNYDAKELRNKEWCI